MTPERLEQIKAHMWPEPILVRMTRCRPGPSHQIEVYEKGLRTICIIEEYNERSMEVAYFLALASTAIPELVAEVERLTDEANDTVREKDERIEDLEAEVERLTDALALGRKAASDATYDRESELAAMAQQVRDLEAELLRCRTAENEAAHALDKIRQDLGLDVGAGPMDVVRGVVGSFAQSRTTREHERRI